MTAAPHIDWLRERLARRPDLLELASRQPGILHRAANILEASPPFGELLIGQPELLRALATTEALAPWADVEAERARLASLLDRAPDEERRLVGLRTFRWTRALQILAADLEGRMSLDQVSHGLSDLADLLLSTVASRVSVEMGLGPDSPIGIVCYGKLGSREMSYASDTDIVFIYDDRRGAATEDLTRLAATVNRWITAHTEIGSLYATDFRLRPHGEGGLLISSLAAFRKYQTSLAWTWEHQALTRARWIACTAELDCALHDVRLEVLRRPRDPDQLRADVLSMRERIHRQIPGAAHDFDVKHSRGGIIDVEFIAQLLILRHAAAHPELCAVTDVSGALARAAALRLVSEHAARAAAAAYRQYRVWMHRERLRGNEVVRIPTQLAESHRRAVILLWDQVLIG
ncbi:MAG TPA: DUF294 nucleotidyltransferase-like domain-containing protein [Polyangia bacterium]|jgi:glutamate-ammonia-ligase adenylyltransferase|nr:DUF294 nucleotidyltransferase-like domain-containing protein [Polyangia bacterium]